MTSACIFLFPRKSYSYSLLFLCFSFRLQPTHLANFNQVQSIQYSAMEEKDRKGMLQLNIAGAPEVLQPCLSRCLDVVIFLACTFLFCFYLINIYM